MFMSRGEGVALKPNNSFYDMPFGVVSGIVGYIISNSVSFAITAFAFGTFFSHAVLSGDA